MELEDVQRNYDAAASYYDAATELIFHRLLGLYRWRRRMVASLGDVDGATVLDIGCGTGNNFPLLAPRVGPAGRIVGIDYSPGMLAKAQRRIDRAGWRNVTLIRDDAARLEHVESSVDATVSAWCLGIVHDLPAALARLLDVTRPAGRIAVMDFVQVRPDYGPLKPLYPLYRRLLIASGIDAPEDLDGRRLAARWREGCALLHARLSSMTEEPYLSGAGLLMTGVR
ncbi:MAG: hypothetical protein CMQ43_02955 [Gammaproteobacteria bacterium]|nr:hypothetical protein [Gammaproteobacteria bacterium]|tara:strand:+ start:10112 stop:10789 length:678 start_codon:yes stop_codon:yes gene_type:complete